MLNNKILFLALFEGISVMLIELLGGKMLIPYFGNSLIIWTSTIGVTMSSLMIGYFLGGVLAKSKRSIFYLFTFLAITAIWISIMPTIAYKTVSLTSEADLYRAAIFSAIVLLAFPLILLGTCPPILIQNYENNAVGFSSGKVFGVSTIGGILSALFFGFFILPVYGISSPLLVYSFVVLICITYAFWSVVSEKIYFLLILLPLGFFTLIFFKSSDRNEPIYISESLQGQLKIQDNPYSEGFIRSLYINGVAQTKTKIYSDPFFNESLWWYVHFDGSLASIKPPGSKVLLMGFGGGSIAHELIKLGFEIDVVEIDGRLPGIAKDYFSVDTSKLSFNIDDARHFIKKNKSIGEKYDLVVIDLLHGEVQPNHIFTVEGLNELKGLIKEGALVIVNYQSNFDEPKKPAVSILKTFGEAHFDAKVTNSKPDRPADYIFIASPSKLPKTLYNYDHMNDCCFNNKQVKEFREFGSYLNYSEMATGNDFVVLYDNYPVLETLNEESIEIWRKNMITNANGQRQSVVFK